MKVRKLFDVFVPVIKKGVKELQVSIKRLTLRVLLYEFISVATSVGFVIIPSFLVGLLFLILHQGRDTILLVTEKMAEGQYFPLFFLLAAIFFWSISSELSVRYSIYISDNSGKNLSDERVFFRKTAQKLIAGLMLLWPYIVILVSLLWNGIYISNLSGRFSITNIIICSVLVYLLMVLKTHLYFNKSGKASPGQSLKTLWGARSLPRQEYDYVHKLYGIYNDYMYSLPKVSNFRGQVKADYQKFSDNFLKDPSSLKTFPQDRNVLNPLRLVPQEFLLSNTKKIVAKRGGLYKWTYFIPTDFYGQLHKKIVRLALVSLVIVLLVAFCPVKWNLFGYIGAPGLICAAFGCYSGIYCGLLYIDKAWLRHWKVSVRLIVVTLFFITTFYNQDHPARLLSDGAPSERADLQAGFSNWLKQYRSRGNPLHSDTVSGGKLPVVFICSEGGALRTGAYTGIYLTTLEDTLAEKDIDFRNSIFAMSGVSGGAVGLGYYNAIAYRGNNDNTKENVRSAKSFFSHDCLSPLVAKMLYGDFLHLFIPFYVSGFDRAVALEESWEVAYQNTMGLNANNVFTDKFISNPGVAAPVFVINTTEVETGFQCWISNFSLSQLRFGPQRDLLRSKVENVRYSTAINFSSRFPLFSPAAKIGGDENYPTSHYIDGGYVENTGSASMLEILKSIKKTNPYEFDQIRPVVIYLLFNDSDSESSDSVTVFNELTEVIAGIYNTRAGRTKTARAELTDFVASHGGLNIYQPLKSENVPMNWVLSQLAIESITKDVEHKLADSTSSAILKQLPLDGLPRIRKVGP